MNVVNKCILNEIRNNNHFGYFMDFIRNVRYFENKLTHQIYYTFRNYFKTCDDRSGGKKQYIRILANVSTINQCMNPLKSKVNYTICQTVLSSRFYVGASFSTSDDNIYQSSDLDEYKL